MTLADFTGPGLIVPQLSGRDAPGVIHELSLALQREGGVTDWLRFYNEALNREYLVSTGLEAGLALPHARVVGLPRIVFALGRSAAPFPWGARDARPVRLVFLVAVPAATAGPYLALASSLVRLADHPSLRDAIGSAADAAGILAVLRQVAVPDMPADLPTSAAVNATAGTG